MYHKVDPWFDIVHLEHDIQAFWTETKAFDKLRALRAGGPRYSFLDGPITANNPMGVHHAWGRTLKDVYQRYQAMTGHALRYQNGFDCQGLWVEVEVEKELGFRSKRDIDAYGIGAFVEKCMERVRRFSAVQTKQSERLGYWMDWSDSYYTMSPGNNYAIWNFLKKCHERGLVYRGTDVMPWCARCGVGLSQMEMHEGYKLTAHRAVFLRFPLRGRDREFLLVWTTTPWTFTSNVAAAVHPDLVYARVRAGGDVYYLAAGTLELRRKDADFRAGVAGGGWVEGVPPLQSPAEFLKSRGGFEVLGTVLGSELVGWTYDGPFDDLPAQQTPGGVPYDATLKDRQGTTCHRVIPWALVSDSEGTGIVHIAPGCGKEDYELGREHGLVAIAPLDEEGHYVAGFDWLVAQHAQSHETTDRILAALEKKALLVHVERYPHSYPHCWRCGSELLFRLVDEWFIAMAPWKQEIMDVVEHIRWIPAFGKELELDWLRNMRDWMISKKRYWGLALPIWVCRTSGCGHFDVIGSRAELDSRAVAGLDALAGHTPHRPWIDAVELACPQCGGRMRRVEDVGNPWLDAGIVPYSTMGYHEDRAYWEQWFPADLVLECFPGQFRNWFYALLAMSTMIEGRAPFRTLLGHALVRDEQGREMHKSLGNAIWFDDAVEQMGADVMRWIYCGQDPTANLNFGYAAGREVRGKVINTLWNTYAFFVNYARVDGYVPAAERSPAGSRPDIDRWALSHLQQLIRTAHEGFGGYDCRAVGRAAERFIDDLSNWYVRRSRRRFWRGRESQDSVQAYETLYECLVGLVQVLAPMVPHVTEAIYQNLVRAHDRTAPESVHHCDFPTFEAGLVDEALMNDMAVAIRLTSAGLAARNQAGLRVRQPLAELLVQPADAAEARAAERFATLLMDELNVKRVTVLKPGETLPVTWSVKPDFKRLGPRFAKNVQAVAAAIKAADPESLRARLAKDGLATLTVDGTPVEILPDDVAIAWQAEGDLAIAEDAGSRVAVRTTLTNELRREGLVRDFVRRVQMLRKDQGLEVEDRIRLAYHTASDTLLGALAEHRDYVQAELLAVEARPVEAAEGFTVLDIQKEAIAVHIAKMAPPAEDA